MTDSGISEAAFDKNLEKVVASIQAALGRKKQDEYFPTVWLIYSDRMDLRTLVGSGDGDLYDVLHAFGRELRPGEGTLEAVFVSASAADEEGVCIFISGSTPDGRLNGARLGVVGDERCRLDPANVRLLYCREAEFRGRTFAGEFLRGFLE